MASAELLQVVRALGPTGRLAGRLDGGQQEGDQDRDDRDHHQQFDQRESATMSKNSGFLHVRTFPRIEFGRNEDDDARWIALEPRTKESGLQAEPGRKRSVLGLGRFFVGKLT